ncbi:MAG TPA: HhH-GPD-type base excision DNA repair protein [Kineosporiaceae bacterium]|nr:HhH-GPD-type base excision DNA repair protein [Kineosporiaceae bacterium]
MSVSPVRLHLAQDEAADALLAADPFALLVGMLLDQQFPMERAFAGPYLIAERMGMSTVDPAAVAAEDAQAFASLMAGPPAVHRYPKAMAGRVQALAAFLIDAYGGDASALWRGVTDGRELFARIRALPGFGDQKARIFLALLGKQFGVRPDGWERAAGDYATPGRRSVADVVDERSLQEVREYKRGMKARARGAAGT